jgi:predicted transcriptional regulator
MTDSKPGGDMIAQIVAAYASRPDVSQDDIVALLARLTGMAEDGTPAAVADPAPVGAVKPALPIEDAITRDKVFCLCCGKGFKMLKRHLGAEHGLSEAEYRAMFNLPEDLPLVAPSYSRKKAAFAKEAGFGKYSRAGAAGQAGTKAPVE